MAKCYGRRRLGGVKGQVRAGVEAREYGPAVEADPNPLPYAPLPHALRKDRRLTDKAILLAAALLEYARSGPRCWPTLARLADDLNCSIRTVQLRLDELVEAGWIDVEPNYDNVTGRVFVLRWRLLGAQPVTSNGAQPIAPGGAMEGAIHCANGAQPIAPELEFNYREKEEGPGAGLGKPRARPAPGNPETEAPPEPGPHPLPLGRTRSHPPAHPLTLTPRSHPVPPDDPRLAARPSMVLDARTGVWREPPLPATETDLDTLKAMARTGDPLLARFLNRFLESANGDPNYKT